MLFVGVFLDGKSYDAFLMCYTGDTDAGLDAHDRKWLENVLEEKFGYSLCLYDRDVLPGKGIVIIFMMYCEENLPTNLNEVMYSLNTGLL